MGRVREALPVIAVCLLAFVLRAILISHTLQVGVFADMQDYRDRAVHLLQTGELWRDAFRVPGFPIFVAGIFELFGQNLVAVRIAQAVLGTATVALTYFVARRLAAPRGGLVAAFLVAVYPALLLYSVYIMAETLFSFLVMLAIVLWLTDRRWTTVLAGLTMGAATLTRSAGLALPAGILVAAIWGVLSRREMGDRRVAARLALIAIGFAVALAPWIQRNYSLYHRFIPTDTSSGFNVLLGNYPGATGRHPGIAAVDAVAQTYWRNTHNDLEQSDIGMKVGRQFVRNNPARAARLALLKVGYLLGLEGREHAWGYSHHIQGRREPGVIWAWGIAIIGSFPLLAIAASFGLWRPGLSTSPLGRMIVATLAMVIVVHVASFGDSRFHLPWVPLLAVLAARAVAPIDARPWTGPRRAGLAAWLVCFALIWWSQSRELLDVLPRLAASPVPLQMPY